MQEMKRKVDKFSAKCLSQCRDELTNKKSLTEWAGLRSRSLWKHGEATFRNPPDYRETDTVSVNRTENTFFRVLAWHFYDASSRDDLMEKRDDRR